jgi:hypothetical protein
MSQPVSYILCFITFHFPSELIPMILWQRMTHSMLFALDCVAIIILQKTVG